MKKFVLAIHGGAGTLLKSQIDKEKERQYKLALHDALVAGYAVLQKGGTALEATEAAVVSMEDSPLFNAGKGSVYTNDKSHELEASIMCGKTLNAGAVAGISTIKNPISLCKTILHDEQFVYLIGEGAERYAKDHKIQQVDPSYFDTEFRERQLLNVMENGGEAVLDHDGDRKFGTVGAVALDQHGNIAAATSTGGLTNKKYGRVGDSSIIGSGCYANNTSCAISATGYGEYFLRNVTAHEIASVYKYSDMSLQEASDKVVLDQLVQMGGEGGIIGIDIKGEVVFSFNSEGMYRGKVDQEAKFETFIFK
ncbi:MAG: isoaspartyl peptidase/L-asparaginase [Cyclobacteriaceae bacterium]